MDQNLPVTTPEPKPTPEPSPEYKTEYTSEPVLDPIVESKPVLAPEPVKSFATGIISLVLGLITWVVALFWVLLDINFFLAMAIAFLSAVLAVFFSAKAKKDNPGSKSGKAGRFLGWLYIIASLAIVIGALLGITALTNLIF